jgi:flagellar biosynthesis GTPase FlhF
MNHTVHFAVLAALLFACTAVFAADSDKNKAEKHDITLKSGKVLKDAVILDKKPNGVTFGYKDGASFVRFSDMPEKAQKYFNYNPEEAEKYEKKIESQKAANKKAAEKQKAKEQKQKAEQDKRNHERRIAQQEQTVRKLELQLEEAKKKLSNTENTVSQDRGALVSTLNDNTRVRVDTPWGVGRIKTSNSNGAVRNKLMKEVDTLSVKRDNQAQDVIDLQLKLEAAQKTLEKLKEGSN